MNIIGEQIIILISRAYGDGVHDGVHGVLHGGGDRRVARMHHRSSRVRRHSGVSRELLKV